MPAEDPRHSARRLSWPTIGAVIAAMSVFTLTLGLSYPLLALILENLGTPKALIGLNAAMTPLGIMLGSIFSTLLKGKAAYGVEAIFDGLAAGTFLYIAILDIMVEVFHKSEDRWVNFFLMALGFALMAIIAVWT